MKPIITLIISLFLFSCNHQPPVNNKALADSLAAKSKDEELSHLKDISELKMNFIDSPEPKVIDVLGQPDKRGESINGDNGFLIYYDLVKQNNVIKTLIITYHDGDVDAVVAANDMETITLPNGTLTIKKPPYFQSIYHNTNLQFSQIDELVAETDTNKITPAKFYDSNNQEVKIYRYDNKKVALIKVVYPLNTGDYNIICYYFNYSGKLMCRIDGDKRGDLFKCKSYIINDKVIKYLRGSEVLTDLSNITEETTFNQFSEAYVLLSKAGN